jgi:hypothetical protein
MGRRGHRMSALTLIERIRRGEAAISRARTEGRDVHDWEVHLEKLKSRADAPADPTEGAGVAPACWHCGATMTKTQDIYGKPWWACWECAKTA